jgi:uncharacterized membrane protein
MGEEPKSVLQPSSPSSVRLLSLCGLVLSATGIATTVYLTIAHYTTSTILSCPDTGIINCGKVTTSSYSEVFGVPLAVLGLGYFLTMFVLQLPVFWRSKLVLVRWGRFVLSALGIPMVFWLIYAELFLLNSICLYCSVVHVLTILLFVLTALGTALTTAD